MPLFHREKKERAIIVGCGRLGAQMAEMLSDQNAHVTVLDRDERAFRRLPASYGGMTLEGDGSDFDTLVQAGATSATLLCATTEDDDVNIMVGQIAKEILKIHTVFVRLHDTEKQDAFRNSGIVTLSPSALCLREFGRIMEEKKAE